MAHPTLPGSYLVLETTNRCSLACVHCTVSEKAHPHHEAVGWMPLERVESILEDLAAHAIRFDTLILFWLGEPLIHPQFGEIYRACVRAAARHGTFRRVEVHTNATHLDASRALTALNAAPVEQVWHFSLDASQPATYRTIKGLDRLGQVEANLFAFLDAQARTGAPWPRPVFQFILSSKNADDAPAFLSRWQHACARRGRAVVAAAQQVPPGTEAVVFFRQLDCPTPEEQERENAVFRRVVTEMGLSLPKPQSTPTALSGGPGVCACLWKSPVIQWDGRITTCTRDNRLENAIGSLDDAPLSAWWWGPRQAARRAAMARGALDDLPACNDCFIPRSANHTDITADERARFDAALSPPPSLERPA